MGYWIIKILNFSGTMSPTRYLWRWSNLAQQIIKLTNSKSKIVFHELPEDEPMQRKPIIALAINKLNWTSTIELEAGVIKTIQYFEKILEVAES
jgi:UDP-glucuronate decarboxylase